MKKVIIMLIAGLSAVILMTGCEKTNEQKAADAKSQVAATADKAAKDAKATADKAATDLKAAADKAKK